MTKRKIKLKMIAAVILLLLFGVLIYAVRNVDVQSIGPKNSEIGFATINKAVNDLFGTHLIWYNITDWLGVAAILIAFGFACLGLYQLISRKSLKKVDADLYLLGAFYAVIMGVYVFFEICIINYRPIILYKDLEASFPSSHTMIVLCIMSTAIFQFNRRIHNNIVKKDIVKKAVNGASILLIAITIIGRLISGVHWFTDILGGLLIGTSLILFYIALVQTLDKSQYVVQNQIDN